MSNEHPLLRRTLGTLVIDQGVIIRAWPEEEDRTRIEAAPGIDIGAIVKNPQTGRWSYDDELRTFLRIAGDPDFAEDDEAGNRLEELLPPLAELNAVIRERLARGPDSIIQTARGEV